MTRFPKGFKTGLIAMSKLSESCYVKGLRASGNDWFRVDRQHIEPYFRLLHDVPGIRFKEKDRRILYLKIHRSHLPMLPGWRSNRDSCSIDRLSSSHHPAWWLDELRPTQLDGAVWLRERRGALLADQFGVGKTRTALAAADPPVMIMCTNSAIKTVWEDELDYLGWSHLRLEGQGYDEDYCRQTPDAWVVNYQNASYWLSYFNDLNSDTENINTKILDEGHALHNARTTWAESWRSCQAQRAIVLSATPIWSYLRTLWAVLDACQPQAWGRLWQFRQKYCNSVQGEYGLVDGEPTEEMIAELGVRLRETMLLRTRGDVGQDLPELKRERLVLDLPADLRAKLFDEVRYSIDPESKAPILEMRTRQREQIGMAKVTYAADELIKAAKKYKRVVYWIWHNKVADELEKLLCNAGIETDKLTGKTPTGKRDTIVSDWKTRSQKPDKPKALVAAIGAASESISLTSACVDYMIELDYLPLRMQQAETRTHRYGQTRKCKSVYVTARDTFDDDLSEKLIAKATEAERVLSVDDQGNQVRAMMGLTDETDREFMERLAERLKRRN